PDVKHELLSEGPRQREKLGGGRCRILGARLAERDSVGPGEDRVELEARVQVPVRLESDESRPRERGMKRRLQALELGLEGLLGAGLAAREEEAGGGGCGHPRCFSTRGI